jgi:hypothetical protein
VIRRALQIGLAVYLVLGISGLAPVVSEAIAGAHGDCCADCEDPGCPEQDGQECPPQCDDCVCPCWVAPLVGAAPAAALMSPAAQDAPYLVGERTHQAPVLRGVFRPPRLSA